MAIKDAFSAEEWTQIVHAPLLGAAGVVAADPGGLVATLKESGAMASALAEAARGNDSGLVGDLMAELKHNRPKPGDINLGKPYSSEEAVSAAAAKLAEACALVDAKAPGEGAGYRTLLMTLCEKVANASKEGGFLGIGGERVSAREEAALAAFATALGVTRS